MSSEHLPIAEVPESTWLRALAHALDPEAESADEALAPDDEPVDPAFASDDDAAALADDDVSGDDADDSTDLDGGADALEHVWDVDPSWDHETVNDVPDDAPPHGDDLG